MESKQSAKESSTTKFFMIIGAITLFFGIAITLFDIMYHPILSSLLALAFITIGSVCCLIAVAKALKGMDDKYSKP